MNKEKEAVERETVEAEVEEVKRELTEQEEEWAQAVATLVEGRANSERNLFVYFESVPEDSRGLVYERAMAILVEKSVWVHEGPKTVQ